jgi:hypothetical protein
MWNYAKFKSNKLTLDLIEFLGIFLLSILIYGYRSSELGIYADDPGFLISVSCPMSLNELINTSLNYVTGRNLHIIWQYLVTCGAGGNLASNIPNMHFAMVIFDGINAVLVFKILKNLNFNLPIALISTIFFLVFPNHGETHYWLSALPMNVISTFFCLLFLHVCLNALKVDELGKRKSLIRTYLLLYILFILSVFTYDQTLPICLAAALATTYFLFNQKNSSSNLAWITYLAPFFIISFSWIALKLNNPGGGPTIGLIGTDQVLRNIVQSIYIWLDMFYSASNYFRLNPKDNSLIGNVTAWQFSTHSDRVIAFFITAILLFFGIKMFIASDRKNSKIFLQFIAAAIFIALAYLPSYIWYISPRHNYLPSIGVALMISILLKTVTSIRSKTFHALIVVIVCFYGFNFTLSVLVDKLNWIESYEYRKNLYNKIAGDIHNSGIDLVIFDNIGPNPYRSIPDYLRQEQAAAISIITNGKLNPKFISFSYAVGEYGYFTFPYNETKFPLVRFTPKSNTLFIENESYGDTKGTSLHNLRSISSQSKDELGISHNTQTEISADSERLLSFIRLNNANLKVSQSEALIAIPMDSINPVDKNKSIPKTRNSDGKQVPVVIDLTSSFRDRKNNTLQIKGDEITFSKYCYYLVGSSTQRLLACNQFM